MLKHLQKSVEEEELVWKSKMSNTEGQLRVVSEFTIAVFRGAVCDNTDV